MKETETRQVEIVYCDNCGARLDGMRTSVIIDKIEYDCCYSVIEDQNSCYFKLTHKSRRPTVDK